MNRRRDNEERKKEEGDAGAGYVGTEEWCVA